MSPDNSKSNADQQKTKKPGSHQDDAKVSGKDADQVKGGFNPQPDPPARSGKKIT